MCLAFTLGRSSLAHAKCPHQSVRPQTHRRARRRRRPAAHVTEQLGVSRATSYKWLRRHAEGGKAALADRSSRPIRMPNGTPAKVEKRVLAVSGAERGAVVLAPELGMPASTKRRILTRHDVPHLATVDPITGERVRTSRRSENRYKHSVPGAMIHVDVKKLDRIPPGGVGGYAAPQRPTPVPIPACMSALSHRRFDDMPCSLLRLPARYRGLSR
jgi:hypothetical protein